MSYTAREQSAYDGHPLELYRFALGGEQWLYTSADHEVAYGADLYQPAFIKRGGFTRGGDTRKSTIEIEVAAGNPVALLFRTGWLAATMVVTIFRHHHEDSEFSVLWKGRVTGCRWSGSMATLTSDSVFTLFRRAGLRRVYQIGCPHALYGPGCGLNANAWRVQSTISAVAGNQVTVAGAGAYPGGWFAGGMLLAGAEYRLITAHSGNIVILVDAVDSAVAGGPVSLWPGCDRAMATCNNRFGNLDNYGGLPFLPAKNPFSGDALV
ncbi:phage BR0599 family protein [Desulfobulbus oligotrophicus]|uniref:Phage BR0599 family protein n=1 Tax=Desulfobulbus oligotrophicus TaxID=1909699 RepID=A0A7T6AR09_9BACT|nr:phage BR0599 family protein [Desulfobulbus oligotrophicus]QQG66368.1 phage BR0599 family protein [Desulfobulbus oligotrophicus]